MNTFNFSIDGAQNLDFFYQPPLDQDEKAPDTDHCTATQCFNSQGNVTASRPANVVGSYAVYSKTDANNVNGTNYGAGKVMHIFRPQAVDASGNTAWCEMHYDGSDTLTVTCPQTFLDSATYPVSVDPTFGYTTVGGTAVNVTDDVIFCSNRNTSISANGAVTNVQFYGDKSVANSAVQAGIYTTDNTLQSPTSGATTINSGTPQWWVTSWSGPSVSTTTNYYACIFLNASTNHIDVYEDSGSSGDSKIQITFYPTWPNPLSSFDFTRKYSIYATYNLPPSAPASLQVDGQTNPTNLSDFTPGFSAIYNDPDTNDVAKSYQIQVGTTSAFTSTYWDSGKQTLASSTPQGTRIRLGPRFEYDVLLAD